MISVNCLIQWSFPQNLIVQLLLPVLVITKQLVSYGILFLLVRSQEDRTSRIRKNLCRLFGIDGDLSDVLATERRNGIAKSLSYVCGDVLLSHVLRHVFEHKFRRASEYFTYPCMPKHLPEHTSKLTSKHKSRFSGSSR